MERRLFSRCKNLNTLQILIDFILRLINFKLKENPKTELYGQALLHLKETNKFNRVLFSAFVQKLNRHLKNQLRAIVLTDTHLYKLDEKFKLKKEPIKIDDIVGAVTSDEPSLQLVVLRIRNSESDFVFYIQSNDTTIDRVPELLANIHRTKVK